MAKRAPGVQAEIDEVRALYRKAWMCWGMFATGLLAVCWLGMAYVNWRDEGFRQRIPAEAEAGKAIYVGGEFGLRGGCVVAIFALAPDAQTRLHASGLRALRDAQSSHSRVTRRSIDANWQETPYVWPEGESRYEDYWAYGISCAWIDAGRYRTIRAALEQPGSFYRMLDEGAVLVIPSAGIVAYVYAD